MARLKRFTTRAIAICVATIVPLQASAVYILPPCASGTGFGNCNTCDLFALGANLAEFILALLGAAVLLMVVLGGVVWIMSAGNPNMVQKGQSILVGAAVGTLIVLGGYFAVNATIASFTGDNDLQDVQLFGSNWATYCEQEDTEEVVSACENARNGTRCSADGCTDRSTCQCNNQQCVPICEAIWAEAGGATCVADANSCGASDGGAGICPSGAPYCCATIDPDVEADLAAQEDAAACAESSPGAPCISASCTTEGVCFCDDDLRCVEACDQLYGSSTAFGSCLPTADDCTDVDGMVMEESGAYCQDGGTPVCCLNEF